MVLHAPASVSSTASTRAGSPSVLTTIVPISGSLIRRRSSASSSSRNARSGQKRSPAAMMPRALMAATRSGARTVSVATRLSRSMSSVDGTSSEPRSSVDLGIERPKRDAWACAGRSDIARELLRARRPTRSLNWLVGYTASTRRHSTARLPLIPSATVPKKSARSRRTLRLSTTRVSPPVPGQDSKQRRFRQADSGVSVVHEEDLVAGERQLVSAARADAVDRGQELDAGMLARVLDREPGFVRELAEVHLPRMRRSAQHEDVRAGAEDALLEAGDDDRVQLPDARSAGAGPRQPARCRRRDRTEFSFSR